MVYNGGRYLSVMLGILLLTACESNDCTLYNTVSLNCSFYSNGKPVAINETLTVTACGTDSILLNKQKGAADIQLPVSYWNAEDTLILTIVSTEGWQLQDTVRMKKTNVTHFESPDCPATMFHQITAIQYTRHFIDSIITTNPHINYGKTQNLQIHLLAAD